MTQAIDYRILSALLSYPQAELLAALPEIEAALAATPDVASGLTPLLQYLQGNGLIPLQENYVATFDRVPSHSLHLFEHIHGESRDRGPAMVDLLKEYQARGFEPVSAEHNDQVGGNELPDYLPLFLEFLGQISADEAQHFLDQAVHVVHAIGERLTRSGSPYAALFDVLVAQSTETPVPLVEPPVRDMDEMLETFGPGADGTEPLLKPRIDGTQPIHIYPRQARAANDSAASAPMAS